VAAGVGVDPKEEVVLGVADLNHAVQVA
jgi:hypothetical protein